jgi:BASS family bile acid:Na+ symporter
VGDFYLQHEYSIASAQLVLAMLGMGATLAPQDFANVARMPRGFVLGLVCVLVVGPVLAVAVGRVFTLEPGITTGLVLIAAVPGGVMSNVLTYFARGNVALSIAMTGTAAFVCLVTTPLVLELFGSSTGSDVDMPAGRIAMEITILLLLPLLAGMTAGGRFPSHRARIAKYAIRASMALVVLMAAGAIAADRIEAGAYGSRTLVAMLCFSVLLFIVAWTASRLARLPDRDAVAIGIEAAFRNTSLAVLIKASVFPALPGTADPFADQVLFVALLYGGIAMLVVLGPLFRHRRLVAAG